MNTTMKITPEKNKESNDIDDSPRKEIENRDLPKKKIKLISSKF